MDGWLMARKFILRFPLDCVISTFLSLVVTCSRHGIAKFIVFLALHTKCFLHVSVDVYSFLSFTHRKIRYNAHFEYLFLSSVYM